MTELHDCCDAPLARGWRPVDRHAAGALADDVVRHAAGAALAAIARRRPADHVVAMTRVPKPEFRFCACVLSWVEIFGSPGSNTQNDRYKTCNCFC